MRQENLNHLVFASSLTPNLVGTPPLRPGMLFLRGILALAFAGFVVAYPSASLVVLTLWVGAYFLVDGFTALFLRNRGQAFGSHRWSLFSGVLGIALGGLMLAQPVAAAVALSLLVGAWGVFLGGLSIAASLQLRADENVSSGGRLAVGFAGLAIAALGTWILFQPEVGSVALLSIVAVNAALLGVASLVLGYQMRRCLQNGECPSGFSRETYARGENHAA